MTDPLIPFDAIVPEPPAGTWVLNFETGHALHRSYPGFPDRPRWYHYPEQRLMTWENALKNYGPLTPIKKEENSDHRS